MFLMTSSLSLLKYFFDEKEFTVYFFAGIFITDEGIFYFTSNG